MELPPVPVEIPDDDYWVRQIKCQAACPVNTDARGYVRAIAAGEFQAAYLTARAPNPLASICARVCGAPCETACRRGALDEPVAIRALKRFVTERHGPEAWGEDAHDPLDLLARTLEHTRTRDCSGAEELRAMPLASGVSAPPATEGPKVAIIGSGPAGLAAAHDLALLGCRPTVFEMEPVPAGMLAVGIPEYRLPRDVIRNEVDIIRALGVEFVCDTRVGVDVTLAEIRRDFAATLIAVGAKRSRTLSLPGSDGPGVLGGVEFLRDVALRSHADGSTLRALGSRVVVIGGGNVAYDVSRTVVRQVSYDVSRSALRQRTGHGAGVEEVHLCCLESIEEMPADDVEILEGREEGVRLHPSLGPVSIDRDAGGSIRSVRFQRCVRVFDESGRFAPLFDADDLSILEADTVIWSVGQVPDLSFLDPEGDVRLDERGRIQCDPDALRTTAPDVFVAGDVAYGTRLLIDAVGSGKRCARRIMEYLRNERLQASFRHGHRELPGFTREPDYEKVSRTVIPATPVEARRASQTTSVERGFDPQEAVREASRCLDCGVNTIFDSERCILCGGCADVCPERCLELVSCDRLAGDANVAAALRARFGSAKLARMSAIVKDEERCIRCGLCADRCPTGAISMERLTFAGTWTPSGAPRATEDCR
jgi:NADPH-dependent glutamate synthase beta subunit-like oxidoreductase